MAAAMRSGKRSGVQAKTDRERLNGNLVETARDAEAIEPADTYLF